MKNVVRNSHSTHIGYVSSLLFDSSISMLGSNESGENSFLHQLWIINLFKSHFYEWEEDKLTWATSRERIGCGTPRLRELWRQEQYRLYIWKNFPVPCLFVSRFLPFQLVKVRLDWRVTNHFQSFVTIIFRQKKMFLFKVGLLSVLIVCNYVTFTTSTGGPKNPNHKCKYDNEWRDIKNSVIDENSIIFE